MNKANRTFVWGLMVLIYGVMLIGSTNTLIQEHGYSFLLIARMIGSILMAIYGFLKIDNVTTEL